MHIGARRVDTNLYLAFPWLFNAPRKPSLSHRLTLSVLFFNGWNFPFFLFCSSSVFDSHPGIYRLSRQSAPGKEGEGRVRIPVRNLFCSFSRKTRTEKSMLLGPLV